jgi:formiminotetrahydrofolate cyclodeaminase
MDDVAKRTVASYLAALAAPTPAPGGGSAAAIAAASAAALVEMVAGLSRANAPDGPDAARHATAIEGAAAARAELLLLADTDAVAYGDFIGALRLPKSTDDERVARGVAIDRAAVRATEVPLATLQAAVRIAELAASLVDHSRASAASDLDVARRFALAAGQSAADNVEANLPYIESADTRAHFAQMTAAAMATLNRVAV